MYDRLACAHPTSSLTHILRHLTQNAAPQQPNNQPTKDLREDNCTAAHAVVPRSVAIPAVDHIVMLSNKEP